MSRTKYPTMFIACVALAAACNNDEAVSAPRTSPANDVVPTGTVANTPATGPIKSGVPTPNVCADVRGGTATAPAAGAPLQAWQCHGGANQRFLLQTSGAVEAYGGQLCLDVYGAKANDGDPVVAWTCHGGTNQKWTVTSAGELRTAVNGKCLDLWGAQGQNGAKLVVWSCHGGSNQKWAPTTSVSISPPTTTPTTISTSSLEVGTAELPRTYLNTAMPAVTGRTISVPAGGDLQGALNAALPGDQLVLAAGASYVGNFTLPAKASTAAGQWITIRSAGTLPAEGVRVGPANAAQMAKILTPNAAAALSTAPGAQGWRLSGVEISATPTVTMTYVLVAFGTAGTNQQTLAQVPSRLVVDRSYVHGSPTLDVRRCIALNSASTAVIDSYISECHSRDGDSQAVMGWNGPGPFKIVNNRLEGGHENIAFGGGDPSVPNVVPSDIEIRRNHVIKPAAWRGVWPAKNLLELKAGRRVLVEANVFENNWVDAQNGFAFLWWSVNQEGGCTWCTTQDVTYRYNQARNVAGGFNLTASGDRPVPPLQRVTIAQNVITGLDNSNGRLYQINGAVSGVTIANNSGFGLAHDLVFVSPSVPVPSLIFRNNVTGGQYTFFAGGSLGNSALSRMGIPAANVAGNVFASGSGAGAVPTGNTYASSVAAIGFTNLAGGDMTLSSGSQFTAAGESSTQPGANVTLVNRMIQGVIR